MTTEQQDYLDDQKAKESSTAADSQERSNDPFSPEMAAGVQLVVQMRIYDALMGILAQLDGDAADELADIHAKGGIFGSFPYINIPAPSDTP